jgi:hypothetical protein
MRKIDLACLICTPYLFNFGKTIIKPSQYGDIESRESRLLVLTMQDQQIAFFLLLVSWFARRERVNEDARKALNFNIYQLRKLQYVDCQSDFLA